MGQFDSAKNLIVETAQQLTKKGYLMATGGNLSVRIAGQSALAITPSNYDYMKMLPEDICVLDFELNVLEGSLKPSVESGMHAAIYQVRPGCERGCPHPPGVRQRADAHSHAHPGPVRRADALPGPQREYHSLCPLRDRDAGEYHLQACA